MSKVCCLHSPTESGTHKYRDYGSDLTALVHDVSTSSGSRDNNLYPIKSSVDASGSEAGSNNSFEVEEAIGQPRRLSEIPRSAHRQSAIHSAPLEIRDSDFSQDSSPNGSTGRRSPAKGPGLGSIGDAPPSRLSLEAPTEDIQSIVNANRRRRSACCAQAPDLPTRLEVCVDRTRGKRMHQQQVLLDSTLDVNNGPIGSHPLDQPPSPLADPVCTPVQRSDTSRTAKQLASRRRAAFNVFAMTDGVSRWSGRSDSPASHSRRSSDSTSPEEAGNQPTKQKLENRWDFNQFGIVAPLEMEMKPTIEHEKWGDIRSTKECTPKLKQWHVRLELEWVSQESNDLVAEVCLLDLKTRPESVVSGHFEVENRGSVNTKIGFKNTVDVVRRTNQQSVVYIVDRVLSELQKQKIKAKNKTKDQQGVKTRDGSFWKKARGLRQRTKNQKATDGTEIYCELCSDSALRVRRRQEVLEAFEVLIVAIKKEIESNGYRETADTLSERLLTEAVYDDLGLEISRLQRELENKDPSSEDISLTEALVPRKSGSSFRRDQSTGESEELCFYGLELRGKRINSDPSSSTDPFYDLPNTSVRRSTSCFTEQATTPQSLLESCLPLQRDLSPERLSKIAIFSEAMLSMKCSDLDARAD